MDFTIQKPKTRKGLSYVLKSSLLKDEIERRNLDSKFYLEFWTPQRNNKTDCSLVEVEFWLASYSVHYDRFYIRVGVVPAEERKLVSELVEAEVLPKLMDWMTSQLSEPINSTKRGGSFRAFYFNQKLIFEHSGSVDHFGGK